MIDKQDKCPSCREKAILVYTPNHEVCWGKYTTHGEQILYVDDFHFKCIPCGFEYYTVQQIRKQELQINEQLKEKLGIDWLEECRIRRENRKKELEELEED